MYAELLKQNPLLGRIESACKDLLNWTDEEIRTLQLLTALRSNSSLMERVKELEALVLDPSRLLAGGR